MNNLTDQHLLAPQASQLDASAVHIYLVGAGPGDPGLITVEGVRALQQADVVIHDYLASPALMSYVPAKATRLYVGKKGFSKHVTQDEINKLLVTYAQNLSQKGKGVLVRLKGGDPFVFGRGGEEALALKQAGFTYSIIPGVSSGIAAPAYAGIPVTHRGVASSMMFVTGNEDPHKPSSALNWKGIAQAADTLCFYMGVHNLPDIALSLISAGRPRSTPVALVRWGTTARQQVLKGTLADIAQRAQSAQFQAPAIIIVGKVVNLSDNLAWFKPGPLAGMTIAVTRPGAQRSTLSAKLESLGAQVIELPTIAIAPPPNYDDLDRAIGTLDTYRYVVFTSAHGVAAFFERLGHASLDARALFGKRVAVIGSATGTALKSYGIVPDIVPPHFRAESLVEALLGDGLSAKDSVLVPRALKAREILPETLKAHGVCVDVVAAYQTILPPASSVNYGLELVRSGGIDAVTFTSSSTVDNFMKLLRAAATTPGMSLEQSLKNIAFYSIGPITSQTAHEVGIQIEAQASVYSVEGLIETIVKARSVHTGESER